MRCTRAPDWLPVLWKPASRRSSLDTPGGLIRAHVQVIVGVVVLTVGPAGAVIVTVGAAT